MTGIGVGLDHLAALVGGVVKRVYLSVGLIAVWCRPGCIFAASHPSQTTTTTYASYFTGGIAQFKCTNGICTPLTPQPNACMYICGAYSC